MAEPYRLITDKKEVEAAHRRHMEREQELSRLRANEETHKRNELILKRNQDSLKQRIMELQDQVLSYQDRIVALQQEVLELRELTGKYDGCDRDVEPA